MLNKIWTLLLIVGIVAGIINGKIDIISSCIIESSNNAVMFAIGLVGIVAFWNGMIQILDDSGVIYMLSKFLEPIISKIFPSIKNNTRAKKSIITNVTANFLGLGNAATPSGIEAVSEMQNDLRDVSKFLIINSAGIQLLPTTIIALRAEMGSNNPTDIIIPAWIVSLISLIFGLLFYYIISKLIKKIRVVLL